MSKAGRSRTTRLLSARMPASTRSSTKQARIDNPKEVNAPVTGSKRKAPEEVDPPKKGRKVASKSFLPPRTKKAPSGGARTSKATEDTADGDNAADSGESILINRAPVLELWAACVAAFLYSKLPWSTALSIGSAISTLCAVAKGRAIGTIDPPDPDKAERKRRERAEREDFEDVEVMGFNVKLKDGQAMVGDKAKKANEDALRNKYGESEYDKAKDAFEKALSEWQGKEDDLDGQAFHFYEVFRPTVPPGQKGWGRKGMLNLATVRSATSVE